ncbi:MAG: PilZ domain-containing protein [Thermodesulfobacteriota bacterium]
MDPTDNSNSAWERRRAPRIPIGVAILTPSMEKIISHNLSKTGCFLPASGLGAIGDTLSLLIDLPEIGLIPVEARIVHLGEDGQGTGIQFQIINPEDRIKLLSFLNLFES